MTTELVNNPNFGVDLSFGFSINGPAGPNPSATARVDAVRLTLYHSPIEEIPTTTTSPDTKTTTTMTSGPGTSESTANSREDEEAGAEMLSATFLFIMMTTFVNIVF